MFRRRNSRFLLRTRRFSRYDARPRSKVRAGILTSSRHTAGDGVPDKQDGTWTMKHLNVKFLPLGIS